MKRFFFVAIVMATICSLKAAQVGEVAARQVADKFFSSHSSRFMASGAPSDLRLAYTARDRQFYVFDRSGHGGFVVVAGDDRLPQVLGYGDKGDFSEPDLPPAVQYWMNEMERQITYLQAHGDALAHRPVGRANAVGPLLTTRWSQDAPYNNYCPSLGNGTTWEKVPTIYGLDAVEAPPKCQYCAIWMLDLTTSQPAQFRIAMTGGGTAATYLDDFALYYTDSIPGDVNGDGMVNIADINAVIHMILSGNQNTVGDVNADGGVNITDINVIIDNILH